MNGKKDSRMGYARPSPFPVDSGDELGQLAAAFNEMQQQLEQLELARKKFIATASHELRTPLSLMQTRLQVLMQDKQQNDIVHDVFTAQLSEVKQMNKMVNEFLLLSELRNGSMTMFKRLIKIMIINLIYKNTII